MTRSAHLAAAVLTTLALGVPLRTARAESIVKEPGVHPSYRVELEPHFLFQPLEPPRVEVGAGPGFGPGVHVAIEFLDNGPIPTINNTMALGFGLDWIHFTRGGRCIDAACEDTKVDHYYFPVVVQWNFWLTDRWRRVRGARLRVPLLPADRGRLRQPHRRVGARFHVAPRMTLTLRAGYPTTSAGLSFLL
jgi:hypothetical protein